MYIKLDIKIWNKYFKYSIYSRLYFKYKYFKK